jgi:hypothetical protein
MRSPSLLPLGLERQTQTHEPLAIALLQHLQGILDLRPVSQEGVRVELVK